MGGWSYVIPRSIIISSIIIPRVFCHLNFGRHCRNCSADFQSGVTVQSGHLELDEGRRMGFVVTESRSEREGSAAGELSSSDGCCSGVEEVESF